MNYLSKMILIIITFTSLVIAPLTLAYMSQRMTNQRLILNEAQTFVDKIADKGYVTGEDIDKFNLGLNSHGLVMDSRVHRLVRSAVETPDGKLRTIYTSADEADTGDDVYKPIYQYNKGDIVKIDVNEVAGDTATRFVSIILKLQLPQLTFNLAKVVD